MVYAWPETAEQRAGATSCQRTDPAAKREQALAQKMLRSAAYAPSRTAVERVENATALIWRLLVVAEKRFRKLLDAPAF